MVKILLKAILYMEGLPLSLLSTFDEPEAGDSSKKKVTSGIGQRPAFELANAMIGERNLKN